MIQPAGILLATGHKQISPSFVANNTFITNNL